MSRPASVHHFRCGSRAGPAEHVAAEAGDLSNRMRRAAAVISGMGHKRPSDPFSDAREVVWSAQSPSCTRCQIGPSGSVMQHLSEFA
jgi:hypothetical protein